MLLHAGHGYSEHQVVSPTEELCIYIYICIYTSTSPNLLPSRDLNYRSFASCISLWPLPRLYLSAGQALPCMLPEQGGSASCVARCLGILGIYWDLQCWDRSLGVIVLLHGCKTYIGSVSCPKPPMLSSNPSYNADLCSWIHAGCMEACKGLQEIQAVIHVRFLDSIQRISSNVQGSKGRLHSHI